MLNFILAVVSSCLLWFNVQAMWNWFVVPFGVMSITFLHAGALLLFVKYIQLQHIHPETINTNKDKEVEVYIFKIVAGLVILLFAWIFHISM